MTENTNVQRMNEIATTLRDAGNMDTTELYRLIREMRGLISAEMAVRTGIADVLETVGCGCPDVEDLQPECPIHGEEPLLPGTITPAGYLLNSNLVGLRTSRLNMPLADGQEAAAEKAGWMVSMTSSGKTYASRTLEAADAYDLATSRGFEYWPGGDEAPTDYDSLAPILFRSGRTNEGVSFKPQYNWSHNQYGCGQEKGDIIGYRKRAEEPAPQPEAPEPSKPIASQLGDLASGMKRRERAVLMDKFAAEALNGFCGLSDGDDDVLMSARDSAKAAYNYAASMMAERERCGISDGTLFSIQAEMLAMLKELVDMEGPQPGDADWGGRAVDLIARAEKLV